jgi:hypothetical protein
MDPRLSAILRLRAISRRFAVGELPFNEFLPALKWYSFDDENDEGRWEPRMAVKDLCQELHAEYLFYVKWRGEAGADKFKSSQWVYGESKDQHGWIDKQAYHRLFTEEFCRLKLSEIP